MIGEEKNQQVSNITSGPTTRGKKRKAEEIASAVEGANEVVKPKSLKVWKVNPDNDEGLKVPQPKLAHKANGLKIIDYIIGKGPVPKPGATMRIVYDCLSAEGELFDSVRKKKDALQFRKGLRQIVEGLDLGIENMRIGGAREIIVPPELG